MKIETKFRLTKTGRGINAHANAWDMDKITDYIIDNIDKKTISDIKSFLEAASNTISTITLYDDKKNELDLYKNSYKPFLKDQITFLFGQIIDVKHYKKDVTHIMCQYFSNGNIYKGCFIVPNEMCYQINNICPNGHIRILVGTVMRKDYKIPAQKKYNERSHCLFISKPAEIKAKNKMLSCYIKETPLILI